MAIKVSGILIVLSFIFGAASGHLSEVSTAALEGSQKAVTLTLSLLGLMGLWCGIMRVLREAGVLERLARWMAPLLRLVFPDAWRAGRGIPEIAAALIANVLGIGNAATPLAVSAMKALAEGQEGDTASDDMVTFTVLGTAFPCFLPTTVIALRSAAGSQHPFDILPAVWLCSSLLSVFAVLMARGLRRTGRGRRRTP